MNRISLAVCGEGCDRVRKNNGCVDFYKHGVKLLFCSRLRAE